jgi:hypothetical protein
MIVTLLERLTRHLGREIVERMGRSRLWVNVYHLELCYGGPEEGGWYYDRGTPVYRLCRGFSTRRRDRQRAAACMQRMVGVVERMNREEFRYDYESVCGGEAYTVRVEDHPPRPYPVRRPHYE